MQSPQVKTQARVKANVKNRELAESKYDKLNADYRNHLADIDRKKVGVSAYELERSRQAKIDSTNHPVSNSVEQGYYVLEKSKHR